MAVHLQSYAQAAAFAVKWRFVFKEKIGMNSESGGWKRELWIGDNLAVMRGMNSATVDLIYLDPPFNSKRMYEGKIDPEMGRQSFSDIWGDSDIAEGDRRILQNQCPLCAELIDFMARSHGKAAKSYLSFMGIRLMEMHRLLKNAGSIYLHCDMRMSHPLKLLMDAVFGGGNFRNEIAWCYRTGGASRRHYSKKSDAILFYAKSEDCFFAVPKAKSHVQMSSADIEKRYIKAAFDSGENECGEYWDYMSAGDKMRIYKDREGYFTMINCRNWWTDINAIVRYSKERVGWATQKPLALLERIIKASSGEGDVVLDPFCGCGTACIAATHLGRQWIGIDQHPSADAIMRRRMTADAKLAPEWDGVKIFDAQTAANLPKRADVRPFKKDDKTKRTACEMQKAIKIPIPRNDGGN